MRAGSISQTLTYPFDVLRRKMQVIGMKQSLGYKYNGAFDALRVIVRTEGIPGLYRGLWPNLCKRSTSLFDAQLKHMLYSESRTFDCNVILHLRAREGLLGGQLINATISADHYLYLLYSHNQRNRNWNGSIEGCCVYLVIQWSYKCCLIKYKRFLPCRTILSRRLPSSLSRKPSVRTHLVAVLCII